GPAPASRERRRRLRRASPLGTSTARRTPAEPVVRRSRGRDPRARDRRRDDRRAIAAPRRSRRRWAGGRRTSYFLRLAREGGGHRGGEPPPVAGLLAQPFPAGGGQLVELRAAVVVGSAPVRVEQPLLHEAEEGRIERALFDQQPAAGNLLDPQQHAVAVQRA